MSNHTAQYARLELAQGATSATNRNTQVRMECGRKDGQEHKTKSILEMLFLLEKGFRKAFLISSGQLFSTLPVTLYEQHVKHNNYNTGLPQPCTYYRTPLYICEYKTTSNGGSLSLEAEIERSKKRREPEDDGKSYLA